MVLWFMPGNVVRQRYKHPYYRLQYNNRHIFLCMQGLIYRWRYTLGSVFETQKRIY